MLVLAIAIGGSAAHGFEPKQEIGEDAASLDARIQRLIGELADPSYAKRTRARLELERLGLLALDAIRDAEESPDTEIAFSARFLMSSMQIEWSEESDPAPVRALLDDYESFGSADRRSAMDRLASLPDWQGLVPLTRLARFEPDLRLSRHAALLAMRFDRLAGNPDPAVIRRLQSTVGDSRRVAADWLRQYCVDVLADSYDQVAWREAIAAERELVELASNTSRTDPLTLLELYRVCATRALADQQRAEALRLAMQGLDNVLPRRQDLMEAVGWALDAELYEVVLELQQREPQRFADQPELIYGVAEAYRIAGQQEKAETLRQSALTIDALPEPTAKGESNLPNERIEELAMRHHEIGQGLESRGLFAWAEGEYRHVIDRLPIDSNAGTVVRHQLAMMLGNLNQHSEVVDVLAPLVDRLEKDSVFRDRMEKRQWKSFQRITSKLNYHLGLSSDGETARSALQKAAVLDRGNIDIVIAMYRQPGDDDWHRYNVNEVKRLAFQWAAEINREEQRLQRDPTNLEVKENLAFACNQFAWLVANTEGDKEQAVNYSQRSVALFPNESAYLDTLARCYYAIDDFESAITYQRMAIGVDPHLPSLRRQLDFFIEEREKAESQGGDDAKATGDAADGSPTRP
jgi:tetratricopeptide (TPR) repeat protein